MFLKRTFINKNRQYLIKFICSSGLQEYIESVTFYHYLANNQLASLDDIQAGLTFILQDSNDNTNDLPKNSQTKNSTPRNIENRDVSPSVETPKDEHKQDIQNGGVASEECSKKSDCTTDMPAAAAETVGCVEEKTVSVPVPPTEYMLGVADFTGELMKMAITSVGSGDLSTPTVVRTLYFHSSLPLSCLELYLFITQLFTFVFIHQIVLYICIYSSDSCV